MKLETIDFTLISECKMQRNSRRDVPEILREINGFHLRNAVSPSSDGLRRRSWACILASVANSKRVHVYSAFRFDLVALNSKCKFFKRNFEDFGGFRHDLRSDHDLRNFLDWISSFPWEIIIFD